MRRVVIFIAALAVLTFFDPAADARADAHKVAPARSIPPIAVAELPREARETLTLIRQGGPFPYPRDGVAFGNFEGRLPLKPRGYYREYTVRTPGLKNRGARRIISGNAGEYYYTDDHYVSFRRIRE